MDPNDARTPNPQPSDLSDDEATIPELPQVSPDASNRRNFLKAAVVASAAVAAAGGAAGAALLSGRQPSSLIKLVGDTQSGDPCDACIEGTGYTTTPRAYCTASNNSNPPSFNATTTDCTALSPTLAAGFTVNGPGMAQGDFEIFFVDHAPASGTINLTVTVTGQSVSTTESGVDLDSSNLFNYLGGGSSVLVTEQTAVPTAPCMSEASDKLSTYVRTLAQKDALHGSTGAFGTSGISYTPCTTVSCKAPTGVVGTSTDDVLVQLHMKWVGGKISSTTGATQLYTFKFSWTDTGGTSCTKYLYIYGQQD